MWFECNEKAKSGRGLSHIGLFHLMKVQLGQNLQVLGCFYISLDTFLGDICGPAGSHMPFKVGGAVVVGKLFRCAASQNACMCPKVSTKINHSNYIPVVLIRCWPMCLLAAQLPALLRRVFTTMDKLLWVNSQNYASCRDSSSPAAAVTQSNYDLLWRLVKTVMLPRLRLRY